MGSNNGGEEDEGEGRDERDGEGSTRAWMAPTRMGEGADVEVEVEVREGGCQCARRAIVCGEGGRAAA